MEFFDSIEDGEPLFANTGREALPKFHSDTSASDVHDLLSETIPKWGP